MDIKELYKSIGQKVRDKRISIGMTLEELSEKVDRDWSYLSQIERGKSVPSIETLVKISEVLDIPLGDLFKTHKPVKKYKADPYLEKINYILKDKDDEYKKIVTNFISQVFKKKFTRHHKK